MRAPSRPRPSVAGGFTLVEVLVAFAVAAVMLGALYGVFGAGLRSTIAIEHYRDAVLIGESSLDALANVPISPGDSNDSIGIYQRSVRITARTDLMPLREAIRVIPYEIEVRIAWRDGIRRRSIAFDTLRLAPAPQ